VRYGHTSGGSQVCGLSGSLAIGLVLVSTLAACDVETPPSARYDEVVARVNGEEITVHQLNERLAQIGLPAEGDPGSARKQLLDNLIDEQLLVQKAIAAGLDRNLAIRNAIERARKEVLAQAAIDDSGEPDVSEREARSFYLAHPDLFGKRKVYTFRRFQLERGRLNAAVKAKLDSAKTGAEVATVLDTSGLAYSRASELRTAESLPTEILGQAARMVPGDILLVPEGSRTILMQLAGSVAEPVSLEAAMPSIRGYLADVRRRQKAGQLVKDLRRKAKIEYVIQTAKAPQPTAVADSKSVLGEPPSKKPLQSQQITVVR
jgi:EpsD family peptidyl-prolyl cis-trans isomerase